MIFASMLEFGDLLVDFGKTARSEIATMVCQSDSCR